MVSILKTLNVEENNRGSFLQKLEKGSLAVLSSNTEDKPMVLIDASQNEGALLMDATIEEAETTVVAASKELLESREIVDTPLGEIEFTIDTQGRDFSVVQLQMEDGGIYMDTLFKTDADGNPLIFESEIISYSEEYGPLEDWLSTLTYGIYNYSLSNSDTKETITTINSNDSNLATNLLTADPLFDFNELEKIDGSAYLIDLDQNNTIDLINMLLVDQGWFDTRPDVVGLIGDPLIPVSTTLKEIEPEAGGGDGGVGTSEDNLEESPSDEIDTEPDEADNEDIDTPDVIDQPDNPDNENDSNAELPPVNPDNVPENGSPSLSFEPGTKPKEQADGTSTPTSPKFDDTNNLIDKPSATNNSQDPQNGIPISNPNQSKSIENASQVDDIGGGKPENTLNRLLNNAQNWLSSAQRQTSNALRSIISPLETAPETSIAAALGMIMLPVLTERSATQSLKAANKNINLKLLRRDPLFNGYWVIYSRNGGAMLIERKKGKISIKPFDQDSKTPSNPHNFNPSGSSLLSQSLKLCRKPGAFVRSLDALTTKLTDKQTTDVNWNSWFNHHFKDDRISRSNQKESAATLDKLRSLIEKATNYEPAYADILMLRQVIDCKEMLGLETTLDEEESVENKVLDYKHKDEFKMQITPAKGEHNTTAA